MNGKFVMTFEQYLADPCPRPSLTRSTIKDLITKTPRHAFWNHPKLNPDFTPEESATHFDIGTAAHTIFLEGTDDIAVSLPYDDWRKKEAQAARDEARANGKVPLLAKQYDSVMSMVEVANKSLSESELGLKVEWGEPELTYIWQEQPDDLYCRIRTDWINTERTIILDYKTTSKLAEPEDFSRVITQNGLDIQDAFYRRGVSEIEGTTPDFIFMVQEVDPPYLCSFIELDLQFQEMGKEKVKRGLHLWRECIKSGVWPSYSNRIYTVEPPSYSLAQWEMRKAG